MPKIPDCDRCWFNSHSLYMVCQIHPNGVEGSSCLDFRFDPKISVEELWEPEGVSYYDGELILQPKQRLSREQQLMILDTHPFFTGVCPECGYRFPLDNRAIVHFDCPECGWIDNSI